nr:integrase, catalytic region, zinc finger, CCHC-type, peptidase aspartic, catalytic [Tanacetum cinerariifolium]
MFLIHSNEALEIKRFKRSRENKIKFAFDYGNWNTSYVNEKINFSDDYFQKIINPDFEKIDSPFQQTSSLKPYVPNMILEKIIIDLEEEVVSLLEKEKENLKTIESLKSKGFESSENAICASENQSENNSHVVEKECDKVEIQRETSSAYVCNDATNVSCNSTMCDLFDDNNFFIFDDESVRISPVTKMPFRKKPRDSMNIVQIFLWIIDSGCSKHMTGNHALLTNFMEKFLGTVRFGSNDFAVIAGYGDEERYEYMIRYSALFNNDKQHRKQIADQEVLFDKMSVELVELDKHVRDLKNTILEKDFKISELEECVCNKDLEIEKCLERLNLTSSLKPYVPNVILEKIIIDLEEELVSLLEKEKENLKTIESLKSKGFESSENAIFESENQSENNCHVVEKECDKVENSKVIAPGMFKLSVS